MKIETKQVKSLLILFLLSCLMTAGLLVRLHELDTASLSHDEISMVQYTKGLLTTGIPSKITASFQKPLTTYELLPYSIAVPVMLFGFSDFTVRLHSVFWGTLEILLLFILGKTLFNRAVGFVAALIYTFHPWCIIWSQSVVYPQLTQVLTTLTVLFFFKTIDASHPPKKYIYLTSAFFCCTYLSWEGSGFLLIAMALALVLHKGTDVSWLRNKHIWLGFAIIVLTIFIQQSRRLLYQAKFHVVGSTVSDVSLPQPYFLDPMYYPYYYIYKFFLIENNYILSVFLIAGIFLILKNKPLRYLYTILIGVVFCQSNFISIAANRYVYNVEPFLILIAPAVSFQYITILKNACKERTLPFSFSLALSAVMITVILFLSTNMQFLKLYLLSAVPSNPPALTRQNVYWNDYRSISTYVGKNMREGDIVFSSTPHALDYYAGIKGDFSLSTLMGKAMIIHTRGRYPVYIDKFMGNPILTSLEEFKRIVKQHDRIWFVTAPQRTLYANDDETIDYIRQHFKVVYESYNTKVYFWEK